MTVKALSLAAREVNQIFRYMEEAEVNKIPLGLRLFFKDIENEKYIPDINPERSIDDQELLPETEQLLGMIYYYYWSEEKDKGQIPENVKKEAKSLGDEIFNNYSDDIYFEGEKQRKNRTDIEELISVVPKEPWYKKLFGWFKKK